MVLEIDEELVRDIKSRMILHWNYRNLNELPVDLLNHGEHIQEIYLKRNCITHLPKEIGKLENLTNLYLIGNQISALPPEIGQLLNLKVLDLSQNYLRNLPSTIGNLRALQQLVITHNQVEVLPQEIGLLRNLKFLELSGNRILTLPHSIFQGLTSLEEFAVDGNPITSFPRGIVRLQNLRYISACKCNLIYLPEYPFQILLKDQNTSGKYSPKTAVQISSCNLSNKDFKLLFDSNPKLNHLPYWVIQLFGTEVDCFGCAIKQYCADPDDLEQWNSSTDLSQKNRLDFLGTTFMRSMTMRTNGSSRIKLDFKGTRHALHFDEDLMKIHKETTKEPPTLLEFCLRAVYDQGLLQQCQSLGCFSHTMNNTSASPTVKGKYSVVKTLTTVSNSEDENEKHNYQSSTNSKIRSSEMEIEDCSRRNNGSEATTKGQNCAAEYPNQRSSNSSCNCFVDTDNPFLLPNNLREILSKGPVTRCFECMRSMFTETWPVVFSIPQSVDEHLNEPLNNPGEHEEWEMGHDVNLNLRDGHIEIGCIHFCGQSCLTKFRDWRNTPRATLKYKDKFIFENQLNWRNS